MRYPRLAGRSCILLERCSTDVQTETSIPDQDKLLRAFADEHKMKIVHVIALEGVSGSIPAVRTDIKEILHRKRTLDDFDVLLAQDPSRLTRAGAEHGIILEHDLRKAGVEVIFATGSMPEGDWAPVIQTANYVAAQQYVKSFSLHTARGYQSKLESGEICHSTRPIYGIDRLYIGPEGPRLIIRTLADGSQLGIDPEGKKEDRKFGKTAKEHYRKQSDERIELILGDPKHVETVRRIFRWRFIDGWGRWRITKTLNDENVPAAQGGEWCTAAVYLLLKNPVYTGFGIANRYTRALYHQRASKQPKPVNETRAVDLEKRLPTKVRRRSEWYQQFYPALKDFLEPEVKARAVEWQRQKLDEQGGDKPVEFSRDRHVDSPYILKGILKSAQGGYPMVGRRAKGWRYYRVEAANHKPRSGTLFHRNVPAEELEGKVLSAISEVLADPENIRSQLLTALRKQTEEEKPGIDLKGLEKERAKIEQQYDRLLNDLGAQGALAKRKAEELEARATELDRLISEGSVPKPKVSPVSIEAHVEAVVARLSKLGGSLEGLPPASLRYLLKLLVQRLEVDLDTKVVTFELRLPIETTPEAIERATAVCLDACSGVSPIDQANGKKRLETGGFRVQAVADEAGLLRVRSQSRLTYPDYQPMPPSDCHAEGGSVSLPQSDASTATPAAAKRLRRAARGTRRLAKSPKADGAVLSDLRRQVKTELVDPCPCMTPMVTASVRFPPPRPPRKTPMGAALRRRCGCYS